MYGTMEWGWDLGCLLWIREVHGVDCIWVNSSRVPVDHHRTVLRLLWTRVLRFVREFRRRSASRRSCVQCEPGRTLSGEIWLQSSFIRNLLSRILEDCHTHCSSSALWMTLIGLFDPLVQANIWATSSSPSPGRVLTTPCTPTTLHTPLPDLSPATSD